MNKSDTLSSEINFSEPPLKAEAILSSDNASNVISLSTYREKHLNEFELKSVKSMVAYVGYKQKVKETRVLNVLLSMFDRNDLEHIPSDRYDDVMRYLIELNISEVMN